MSDPFEYDVFLSHANADKPAVRELAQRLKADGLRVWLDDSVIEAGDMIPLAIEHGLETSRALVLVMSKAAFASGWVALEQHTARFRDTTNKQRRFIPVRLDDSEIKGTLKLFAYIDWRETDANPYDKLLRICRWGQLVSVKPNSPKARRVTCSGELHGYSTPWHAWLAVSLEEQEHAYKIWPKEELYVRSNGTWFGTFRHDNKYYPKIVVELIAVQDDEHRRFIEARDNPEKKIIHSSLPATSAMVRTLTMVAVDSLTVDCTSPENE